tara:strand:- start:357 stop:2864 length:2508 start_codon:yes stop_codon:yes gene_type:complete
MANSILVNLKTDLKSLKYGKDRPDGGSSNQPFKTVDIPEGTGYGRDGLPTRSGPDFILRDGFLAPVKGIRDISRLTKMMFDTKSPSGLLFIIKQNLLSRTGVKVEGTDTLGYAGGLINEGIYTPLGTLLQAGFGWAGIHLNKQGLDPTSPMGPGIEGGGLFPSAGLSSYYQYIREINNPNNFAWQEEEYEVLVTNPEYNANQLSLRLNPETGQAEAVPQFITETRTRRVENDLSVEGNRLLNLTQKFIDNVNDDPTLLEYGGGPGSILGFGKTKIKITGDRTGVNNPLAVANPGYFYGNDGEDFYNINPETKELNLKLGASTTADLFQDFQPRFEGIGEMLTNEELQNTLRQGRYTPLLSPDATPEQINNAFGTNYKQTRRPQISWAGKGTGFSGRFEWSGVSNLYDFIIGGTKITSEDYLIEDEDTNIAGGTSSPQKFNTSVYQIDYSTAGSSLLPEYENSVFGDMMLVIDPETAGLMDLTLGSPEMRTFSQEQITGFPDVISQGDGSATQPGDFRTAIIEDTSLKDTETSNIIARSLNYKTQNRAVRVNAGDPGKHFTNAPENTMKNVFKYALPGYQLEALDKITAAPMYEGEGPDTQQAINDLVKFRIAAVLNTADAGRKAVYMHFRAFINSFNDAYNANWGTTNYVGRGNPFYNYTGFTRTIQMSFTVAAQSKAELTPMYSKLNYLASTLAPDYGNNGFMKGNIVRVTMGGYLYEVPGVINNLTYDIPADTTWEIAVGDGVPAGENDEVKADYDTTVKELPHRIDVTMGFTPIHDFLPAKPNNFQIPDQKFISLQSAFNDGLYGQLPEYRSYKATANPDIGSSLSEEQTTT